MKNTYLTIVLIMFIIFNLFSQELTVNITQDTLSNGIILLTIQNMDGTLEDKYLLFEDEYDFDLSLMFESQSKNFSENVDDAFIKNIALPGSYGGCLPLDVCLNTINNKYYLYGSRNVVVIDAITLEKVNEIPVSCKFDFDYRSMWSTRSDRHIIYNSKYNKIYCATLGSELVVINGSDDNVEETLMLNDISNFSSTSVYIDNNEDNLYWFVNDIFSPRILNKINCQDNLLELQYIFDGGIMDMICNSDDTKIFVSTFNPALGHGIKVLSTDDFILQVEFGPNKVGKMVINYETNKLYCDNLSSNYVICYNVDTYLPISYIQTSFDELMLGEYNSNHNLIYFTGFSEFDYGVTIIDGNNNEEYFVHHDDILLSLYYDQDEDLIYCGGRDLIITIDPSNNINSHSNAGSKSYRLAARPNQSGIASANVNEGNFTVFDSDMNLINTIQVGGNIELGCYNETENKLYFIETSSHDINSFVTILNGDNLEVLEEFSVANTLRSIVHNSNNNKVYISSHDSKTIIPIGGASNQILYDEILNIDYEPIEIFVSANNKIYISAGISLSPTQSDYRIYIYDLNTNQQLNIIENVGSFVSSFIENPDENMIYCAFYHIDELLLINSDDNTVFTSIDVENYPRDLVYDQKNGQIYVANTTSSTVQVIEDFNIKETLNIYKPVFLEYNNLDNKIYVLGRDDIITSIRKEEIQNVIELDGKNMGLVYNSTNNRIYTHTLIANDFETKLTSIDCTSDEVISITPFGQFGLPGLNFISNANSMVFSKNSNKLLCGNRAFSNISAVNCFTDKLNLNGGINWISFPRIERSGNDEVFSEPVLERYNYHPSSEFVLYGQEPGSFILWTGIEWEGNLYLVQSTKGYKLDLDPTDGETPHIDLYGAMLDPVTDITIPAGAKEWIGYFIPESQYPWDAFPDELYNGSLVSIKAQYWTMVKDETKGWIASGKVTPIKYGDMVIVRTNSVFDETFTWNNTEESEEDVEIPSPQYYTWEEKEDYTPFYIETDSTSDIMEIAVKVDGETRGATVRWPNDTLVEVDGYILDVAPGAVVEFETWNGYKSTPVNKDEYIVYNPISKSKEKRKIYTGERQPYYKISFKQGEVFEYPDDISHVTCQPNPFNSETTLTMRLNMPQLVWIEIYNISGAKVKTLLEGELPGGYYETTWYGDNDNGNKVDKGIYFYKIMTGNGTVVSEKIVLIR